MQVEKIKLGEGISLPVKLMQVMNVASGEELTVLYSEAGMIIMKPLSDLTDILSHLLPTEGRSTTVKNTKNTSSTGAMREHTESLQSGSWMDLH